MGLAVVLNGRAETFAGLEDGAGLAALVDALGLKADRVAVERNGEIVPRRDWDGVRLMNGDRLEVVHFVGGGCGPAGGRRTPICGDERR